MGTLKRFTEVADAVRLTPGKLEKIRLLAAMLRILPAEDLERAVTFFTGAAFPPSSGHIMQVGFAQLQNAALAVSGASLEHYAATYLRHSDVGDTVGELFAGRASAGLSLAELGDRFEALAAAPAGSAKTTALVSLLELLDADEARYVAKILTGDLRIGLREGLVEEAIAAAAGVKVTAIRRAHQKVGDIGQIAVAARMGRLDALEVALFTPVKPMLASPAATPEEIAARLGPELWIEDKLDGIRLQAHRADLRMALFSRDLKDVSDQFPEVLEALEHLPGELILDGELLAVRDGAVLPFFELQKRLGRKALTASMRSAVPVAYVVFDLIYQDGEPLLDHPFRERRARLEQLPPVEGISLALLRVRPAEALKDEFAAAKARAHEGLMVKDPESPYTPGRRGMSWLKLKQALDPLDVVVTGVELGHGKRREVLSDYTFAVRDEASGELVNIGKAYSGLTDVEIAELTGYFKMTTLEDFGRFRLVRPELVIEVAFEAIQESRRHRSGFALRFPRILRVRTDKTVADINTLEDVRQRYRQYRMMYEGGG